MSKVLFLSMPAHGNVNPTLGLVSELVKQGEEVIYFCSDAFKQKIEATGAIFKSYNEDLDIFKSHQSFEPMHRAIKSAPGIIKDILEQTEGEKFDYIIHSAAFPFTKVIAKVLNLPTVSSLAIFAGLREFLEEGDGPGFDDFRGGAELMQTYRKVTEVIDQTYAVRLPESLMNLIFNKGEINLVYTSKYFAPDPEFFDESYKFVGPPIYTRKEDLDFPFDKLVDKKVIYISLGTVFSNYSANIYKLFFEAFADLDAVIVMAAYNVDLSRFEIPDNFIVRNYVPQCELLKYTDAAITHAGMNSISDLVSNYIPFVAIPLGADQPILAKRVEELGAAISLDVNNLNSQLLRSSIEQVLADSSYLENIKIIAESFEQAGGYPKAVEEIFKMKAAKAIK
jgi:MGT family glycosyltransferase